MPSVLNVDRELGRKIRAAREQRGWSKPLLAAYVGPIGNPPRGLVPNQIARIEAGERNVTADEAWRFAHLFEELDAWELLVAARVVSADSSEEFRQAVRKEVDRHRRLQGLRRLEIVAAATDGLTVELLRPGALPVADGLDALVSRLRPRPAPLELVAA